MIDITEPVRASLRDARSRYSAASQELLDRVHAVTGGEIDWDGDSGEDWATIGPPGNGVWAQVFMGAPLVLVTSDFADEVDRAVDGTARVISVSDVYKPELRLDQSIVEQFFRRVPHETEFDKDAFSARDLWFWTI